MHYFRTLLHLLILEVLIFFLGMKKANSGMEEDGDVDKLKSLNKEGFFKDKNF